MRTRMLEMSCKMSITSRAACRLDAASSVDMLVGVLAGLSMVLQRRRVAFEETNLPRSGIS